MLDSSICRKLEQPVLMPVPSPISRSIAGAVQLGPAAAWIRSADQPAFEILRSPSS
ncbi:MAG: hypothetical protein V7634_179 [Bradyrhizobium sp.]|jgi:hypothetical protein